MNQPLVLDPADIEMPRGRPVDESQLPRMPEIPRRRYLDPAFFALELEHVWRKTWLLVAHETEVPDVGSYRLLDFLEMAPVFLVRGKDRTVRAFLNSCQHRGATVLRAKEGCAKALSCQYHGWTYDLQGRLVGVTQEQTFPHLETGGRGLVELRCEQWGGLVFINFDAKAPALLDWMTPSVVKRYDAIHRHPMRVVWRQSWIFECNWKLPVEAFREAYHIETVHKKTVAQMIDCMNARVELNPNGHGTITVPYWPRQAMAAGEWDAVPTLSNLARVPGANVGELIEGVVEGNWFPNVSFAIQSVGFPIFTAWPIALDRTRVEALWLGVDWGDAPKSAEWEVLTAGSEVVAHEDLQNLTSIQKSLAADPDKGIPLSTKEIAIYQLHAEIDKLIGAERVASHLRVPDLLARFEV
ncbi:MAG TPA: SRPBCC family protein [Nevskiaceae bacterium]|nr:SRPBCC family protein [Nevskiaceae bacterium]